MTDLSWISSAISAARPQAMGALLRYFRDLDTAEEAFQDACLRALKNWPQNGPPRDPAAWLIFVGRNSGIDAVRKRAKQAPMPEEDQISDLEATFARLEADARAVLSATLPDRADAAVERLAEIGRASCRERV